MERGLPGSPRRGGGGHSWPLCPTGPWPSASGTPEPRRKDPFLLALPLQHPPLAKLNRVPSSKGKQSKGPNISFTEPAIKGELELRGYKLLTGPKILRLSWEIKRGNRCDGKQNKFSFHGSYCTGRWVAISQEGFQCVLGPLNGLSKKTMSVVFRSSWSP